MRWKYGRDKAEEKAAARSSKIMSRSTVFLLRANGR